MEECWPAVCHHSFQNQQSPVTRHRLILHRTLTARESARDVLNER